VAVDGLSAQVERGVGGAVRGRGFLLVGHLLVSVLMRQVRALKPVVADGAAGRPVVQACAVVMLAAD
jgi:hypothetical protein